MKLVRKALSYHIVPTGLHLARCCAMIETGTSGSTYNGRTIIAPKVIGRFEILDWHDGYGNTPLLNQIYTVSGHPRSRLRQDMEQLSGRAFTDDELDTMDTSWMVGRYCMLDVTHAESNGFMNAKIAEILPVTDSTALVEPVHPDCVFTIDAPDLKVFSEFPTWIKTMIKQSDEWKGFPRTNGWEIHFHNPPEAVNDSPF